MATVTKENIGLLTEKLIVRVEKDDYLPSFEKAIKTYSKKATIPGFRKGMVPAGMVKKMYGSSVFTEEVIKTVEKSLQDYMQNEKLEIFAQPLPLADNDASRLDMNQPSDYAFSFEIGLKPEFSLPDLGSAPLTRYKVIVTDEMVAEQVAAVVKENRIYTDADAIPSGEFDIDVKLVETDAEGNETEGGINKQYHFIHTDFTPAFREQLSGKTKEDSVVFQPAAVLEEASREMFIKAAAPDADATQVADKSIKMTFEKIEASKDPEMNGDLYDKILPETPLHSEEEFRNEIKKIIEQQWEAPSRDQLHDQIFHVLVEQTQISFPESFLKRWMLTNEEKPKTPEQVEEEYPNFVKGLQWSLITGKIEQENNIDVSREEIEQAAKGQLMGYFRGNPGFDFDQPWVNDYVQRMMKDKKFVDDTVRRIEVEKVFEWCDTQIHPAESPISVEEFAKLREGHNH